LIREGGGPCFDARPKPPRGGKFQREQAAGVAAGRSKPWMKK
jgi:hypothetical protein